MRHVFMFMMLVVMSNVSMSQTPSDIHPFNGHDFFVSPYTQIVGWLEKNPSDRNRAAVLELSKSSQAIWLNAWTKDPDPQAEVERTAKMALEKKQTAWFVCYNAPVKDFSGEHKMPGAENLMAYRSWIDNAASGLWSTDEERAKKENEKAKIGVIIEPDAAADLPKLSPDLQKDRADAIEYAVLEWSKHERVLTYIDAGHPEWIKNPEEMAVILVKCGIQYARGFALNVSNSHPTEECISYGNKICAILKAKGYGNKFFVIDTGRNGRRITGTVYDNKRRRIGKKPTGTIDAEYPSVDAFVWVKPVYEDDKTGQLNSTIAAQLQSK